MSETGKKKACLAATALTIVIVASAYLIGYHQGQNSIQQKVKLTNIVNFAVIRNGTTVYNYTTHNVLTTIGARLVRNILGFDNETLRQVKYVSLSPDTSPSKTWTKLPNEYTQGGLERKAGTPTVIDATNFQVSAEFVSSISTIVKCTGLHWSGTSGSDGNLWAAAQIPPCTIEPNDRIEVTWIISIPDG